MRRTNNKEAIAVLNMIECHGSLSQEAKDLAIKALEKINDVKNHKFLSPDNPDYFGKLPEITKDYQKGWNDALDAVMNDFRYEEEENNG